MAICIRFSIDRTLALPWNYFYVLIGAVIFNCMQDAMKRKAVASIAAAEALEEANATESIIRSLRFLSLIYTITHWVFHVLHIIHIKLLFFGFQHVFGTLRSIQS